MPYSPLHAPEPVTQGPAAPALQVDLSDPALHPVPVVPDGGSPRSNDNPGRAILVSELGHGSVWVQYRRHSGGRADETLSRAERMAKGYGLSNEKLGIDFANLLESEIDRSDIELRVQAVDNAAQKMFETHVNDYHYTQQAAQRPAP